MADLEYSKEALEVKGLFYNKKITVYVEGKDDPLFWDNLFNLAEVEAHIEEVGGSLELEKYITNIVDSNAEFYVATDNDHNDFLENIVTHPRIIRTYGYSIENSMYRSYNEIENTISKFCRKKVDISVDYNKWLADFSTSVRDLIILDIANHKFQKGISIFGDNCYKFLKGQKSFEICNLKTEKFIESVRPSFSTEEIEIVEDLVNQTEKELWFHIKGHFITHAIINLIKKLVRKNSGQNISLTNDFLYTLTIECKEDWENRIDLKTVIDEIKKINN
ncbi:DUF4435 domain-containing protein [Psychroserpens ponticola]|uniref:DUF4435 domain-containing protein n=1 Tax=Psychroserpens ponticola TaxID=2932268 RepID=A0ABY7RTQ5_9FLAO|nr:DUF4435 domain-containing protein [Psychroserpens ponticola]WCO00223.1 DUF4435 domain-containing protein [Psychroserpens ponticola]